MNHKKIAFLLILIMVSLVACSNTNSDLPSEPTTTVPTDSGEDSAATPSVSNENSTPTPLPSNSSETNTSPDSDSSSSGQTLDSYLTAILEEGQFDNSITFDQLARTPDEYKCTPIALHGKVVQIVKGTDFIQCRFAIDNDYSQMIFVECYAGYPIDPTILEDDYVALYGAAWGECSYTTVLSDEVTLPLVLAVKMEHAEIPMPPLPEYPTGPLTLNEYYSSGKLWSTTEIESFEITEAEIIYNGELSITCQVIGTVTGSDYFDINLDCYDDEGFLIDSTNLFSSVKDGVRFKITESTYIPANTVKIKISVG